MQLTVKSMLLEHFKGYENKVIDFGKRTFVKGKNGVGKSTIIAAHDWLWFDKDETLSSSPKVVPTVNEVPNYENLVKVTEVLDIDGREVTVTKIQKNTVSKKADADGIHKLTTSNSYEVNSIPKNEKEFKAYFAEFGIDFDQLLTCSHIDVFLNQKQADMRKVLFAMATGKSDLEICQSKKDLAQLQGLLEKGYKADEVKAMQDSKLKTANKELDGIEPKIAENQRQLVEVDEVGLQASKDGILKVIEECEKRLKDVDLSANDFNQIQSDIMQVKLDMGEVERQANLSLVEQKREIQKKIDEVVNQIYGVNQKISFTERDIKRINNDIISNQTVYKDCVSEYKRWKEQVFDEDSLICPTCKQQLQEEKVQELRESFEEKKRSNMEKYKTNGTEKAEIIKRLQEESKAKTTEIESLHENLSSLEQQKLDLESELSALPQSVDISEHQEYMSLQKKLSELQLKASETPNNDELKEKIRSEIEEHRTTLYSIENQLRSVENNQRIQERIKELEDSKVTLSQQISDCEMILDQLKQLSKVKNASLADEINSKFSKVSWKLFDYQKDGSYKEVCIPILDGFTFDKMNGARRVTTKIDIIAGLQNFYGINVPLFVDEMESVNDENVPETEFQLVMMKVTEDSELKVEVEE